MGTAANVRTPISGAVYVGATTVTAPTDSGTAPAVGFTDLGYVSDQGVTESLSQTSKIIKDWFGTTLRRVVTDGEYSIKLTLIERSQGVLEAYYGATATTGATEGSINVDPTATGGEQSFIIDYIDGSEVKRIYVATGEITERGDLSSVKGDAEGYAITITAYPDSNGDVATIFTTALHT